MPETPMSESAARTSSSLKGLMIAVTSFMSGHSVCEGFRARRILQFPCHDVEWRRNPRRRRSAAGRDQRVLHHPGAGAAPRCSSVVRPGLGYSSPDVRADRDRGGRAGRLQAVDTLRRRGFSGGLTLVGDEPWPPYQRPPLSKKYLAGSVERERLLIRPATFFADHSVTTLFGHRVTDIARRERHVRLDDGRLLPYDALLLATGSRPRRLLAPGGE